MSGDSRWLQEGFDKQLSHLIEEAGEVLAAAGKTQRWGRDSTNPTLVKGDKNFGETNEEWLMREIGDLELAIIRLRCTVMYKEHK